MRNVPGVQLRAGWTLERLTLSMQMVIVHARKSRQQRRLGEAGQHQSWAKWVAFVEPPAWRRMKAERCRNASTYAPGQVRVSCWRALLRGRCTRWAGMQGKEISGIKQQLQSKRQSHRTKRLLIGESVDTPHNAGIPRRTRTGCRVDTCGSRPKQPADQQDPFLGLSETD